MAKKKAMMSMMKKESYKSPMAKKMHEKRESPMMKARERKMGRSS